MRRIKRAVSGTPAVSPSLSAGIWGSAADATLFMSGSVSFSVSLGGIFAVFESAGRAAKRPTGAGQTAHDGADRDLQGVGRLLIAETLAHHQHEYRALINRQIVDRALRLLQVPARFIGVLDRLGG